MTTDDALDVLGSLADVADLLRDVAILDSGVGCCGL